MGLLPARKKAPNKFLIDLDLCFLSFLNSFQIHFFLHFLVNFVFLNHFTILDPKCLDPLVPKFLSLALQDSNQHSPQMSIKEE